MAPTPGVGATSASRAAAVRLGMGPTPGTPGWAGCVPTASPPAFRPTKWPSSDRAEIRVGAEVGAVIGARGGGLTARYPTVTVTAVRDVDA